MKKFILSSLFIFAMSYGGFSQSYQQSIGVRLGMYNGVTAKQAVFSRAYVEGMLLTRWNGIKAVGLFEINNPIKEVKNLHWYYGAGAHIGFWNGEKVPWHEDQTVDKVYTVLGIDGIIGMEYTFKEVPINISLDWKPSIDILGHSGFWADGIAISVRYILKY